MERFIVCNDICFSERYHIDESAVNGNSDVYIYAEIREIQKGRKSKFICLYYLEVGNIGIRELFFTDRVFDRDYNCYVVYDGEYEVSELLYFADNSIDELLMKDFAQKVENYLKKYAHNKNGSTKRNVSDPKH